MCRGRVADDDRLAAAVVQAGQRVLVGHGAGQVEHVGQGRVLARVGVEPGSAQRRAERGGVDGDDGPQAALRVLAEDDLLVPDGCPVTAGPWRLRLGALLLPGSRENAGHGRDYLSGPGLGDLGKRHMGQPRGFRGQPWHLETIAP